jgi:hypothetical protein
MDEAISNTIGLLTAPTELVRDQLSWIAALLGVALSAVTYGWLYFIRRTVERRQQEMEEYERSLVKWRAMSRSRTFPAESMGFQVEFDPPRKPEKPPPVAGAEEELRRRMFISILVVMVLGAAVLLPFAIRSIGDLVRPLPPLAALFLGVVASIFFYWCRLKYRAPYGAVEFAAGTLAMWVIVAQPKDPEQLMAQVVGFAAAVYVNVRGVDNFMKGMKAAGWTRKKG